MMAASNKKPKKHRKKSHHRHASGQGTSVAPLEEMERVVLEKLCDSGGSLSLTALNQELIDDRRVRRGSSAAGLWTFLANRAPHRDQLFRLDEDPMHRDECTVRAKTDAILCQTYNPREDSCQQGSDCQAFHLCSHFVSNRCKRGQTCNWPHQLRSPHNQNILCQNGLACLNDEDILLILRQSWIEITVPDTCKHYNTQSGCNNADCQFLHVCRHYVLGDCRFSHPDIGYLSTCRYSHNLQDPQPLRVWRRFHIDAAAKNPRELLQMLQEKKDRKDLASDRDDEDEDDDEGLEIMSPGNRSNKSVPDTCIHYNGKGCNKGNTCLYFHICSFYVTGKCRYSSGCRRSHDANSPQPTAVWKTFGIDARSRSCEELLGFIRNKKRPEMQGEDKKKKRRYSWYSGAPAESNLDTNEICQYNLRGKCYFGSSCRKVHSEQHYQWQCSDDGKTWTNFGENVAIEKHFCDPANDKFVTTLSDGSESHIDFKTMKRVSTNLQGVEMSIDARRLENPATKMSEANSWQRALSTNWQWHYLDNGNIWVQSAKNAEIEDAYQKYLSTGQDAKFDFRTEHHGYTLNFSRMRQKNEKLRTKREVRRRPKFVTKEMLARNMQKMKVLGVILPKTWDIHLTPDDPQNNFVLCKLDRQLNKEEYQLVSGRFAEKMDAKFIRTIERVQNSELWHEFTVKRNYMREKLDDAGKEPEELLLFHGTEKNVVQAICQQNFDFRVSGSRVGTRYGQGSYFSKSALYSDSYASPDGQGRQRMFLVRVLAGSYTAGDPSYRRPPLKDKSKLHGPLFDSCVDNPIDPLIFVIFDRGQAYPEYLITYEK